MNLRPRTKIVCTIGPASSSPKIIEQLVQAGMGVARLNLSHSTYQEHAKLIQNVGSIAAKLNFPVATLLDLSGPKGRTGKLKEEKVCLREGADFTLTTRDVLGNEREVFVSLPNLPSNVKPGNVIFIDDGAMKLEVKETTATDVRCKVIIGGMLTGRKGVNVPGVNLSLPSITWRDKEDMLFGIEQEVDFIALSFVRSAANVFEAKEFLKEKGADIPIIAKIEKREALENLDAILTVADGIMVARGDLGVETPIEKVPMAQKEIIKKCNRVGKPVIVATQMLESMVHSASPTRAEAADVANSIFDGADAVMLSGETAMGEYPVEATAMMAKIALEAEAALPYKQILLERGAELEPEPDDAISYDACHTAHQLGAKAIVAFTTSGSTARRVAKYHPSVPILAAATNPVVRRRLMLSWGVYPCQIPKVSSLDELFDQGAKLSIKSGRANSGDLIVITAGIPIAVPGTTNLLKVERIR